VRLEAAALYARKNKEKRMQHYSAWLEKDPTRKSAPSQLTR